MIKLTQSNGKTVRVVVEHIIAVQGDLQADVRTLADNYLVKESPEEVAQKVLEYKLGIMRFAGAYAAAIQLEHSDPEMALAMIGKDFDVLSGLDKSL